MAAYMKWGDTGGPWKEAIDGTSNTFMFAEQHAPAGTRLFVGTLSLDQTVDAPDKVDEVLVSFEHGDGAHHPDFLWFPHTDLG